MSEKLILIDGHSILFRAFYGVPLTMTAPDGLHTNAIFGFLNIMSKILEEEKPDYLAVAFDLPAPTFRHKLYSAYKGTRTAAPEEFHEQGPVIKEILTHMHIPVLTAEGWEADDILGTLAHQAGEEGVRVGIISGDRDLLQTVSDNTEVIIPKTKGGQTTYERYNPQAVEEAFGVTPAGFIELKALMGDSSDNVPGLPGVGPKTAQKIMESFGSIENAHARMEDIKPKKAMEAMRDHYGELLLSLELVTIRTDAPVVFAREAFRLGEIYNPDVYEDFRRLGMKSFFRYFEKTEPEIRADSSYEVVRNEPAMREAFAAARAVGGAQEGGTQEGAAEACSEQAACGLSLIAEDGRIYAAALSGTEGTRVFLAGDELPQDALLAEIRALLTSDVTVATHDAKHLLRLAPAEDRGRIFDCVIASYLLDPLKSDWSYDAVAAAHLRRNIASPEELIGKKGYAAASGAETFAEKIAEIAALNAQTAHAAMPVLANKLREAEMDRLFREIEMPLTYVLASMENAGILASREELKKYGDNLASRIDELVAMIYAEAGEEFNINSPKQLGAVLFEQMGLPGGKKTKTGFSTAADVLEKLAPEHPIVANILEYRTLSKLKSTYADGLPAFIEADGRIRTSFKQTVTATGRLSSADPNLQNIPMREELGRLIRKCFFPREGCVFVDADYSQIELRILAHMSGDEKLIEAYREAKDIHRITASQVFHIPFEEVTDLMRRNAKAVNFGIVYGISSFGLSRGLSISRQEAAEYIGKYFETYPKIKSFLDGLVASAKETGYAVSLFGRRRPIPELKSSNFMQRSFGERAAMNSPIQGTAADIMKIGMIRVYRRLREELPEATLILQIHDELLVEVPEAEAERAKKIVSEEMSAAAQLRVALETDSHIGRDWYEAK